MCSPREIQPRTRPTITARDLASGSRRTASSARSDASAYHGSASTSRPASSCSMATVSDAWLGAYKSRVGGVALGRMVAASAAAAVVSLLRRRAPALARPEPGTKFRALLLERHSRAPQRECDEVVVPPTRRRLARKCAPWRGSFVASGRRPRRPVGDHAMLNPTTPHPPRVGRHDRPPRPRPARLEPATPPPRCPRRPRHWATTRTSTRPARPSPRLGLAPVRDDEHVVRGQERGDHVVARGDVVDQPQLQRLHRQPRLARGGRRPKSLSCHPRNKRTCSLKAWWTSSSSSVSLALPLLP